MAVRRLSGRQKLSDTGPCPAMGAEVAHGESPTYGALVPDKWEAGFRIKAGLKMKNLFWILAVIAILFFILGGLVKAVGFLLWIAPILLIAAVVMFLLDRSKSRRA
jgi:hypothetical protein